MTTLEVRSAVLFGRLAVIVGMFEIGLAAPNVRAKDFVAAESMCVLDYRYTTNSIAAHGSEDDMTTGLSQGTADVDPGPGAYNLQAAGGSDNAFITKLAPQCAATPAGIVSWWPAEMSGADIADGNDGTLQGSVTFGTGNVGTAFGFDGNSNVVIPNSPNLNIQSFTLLAWVFPTVGDGMVDVVVNKEVDTSLAGIQYEFGRRGTANPGGSIPTGTLAFFIGGLSGLPNEFLSWVDGNAPVPLNVWTHAAVTFDGTEAKAYVNGVMTRTISGLAGQVLSGTGPLKIGGRTGIEGTEGFNGFIDEVAIFSRALSESEIAGIYEAGDRGICHCTDNDADGYGSPGHGSCPGGSQDDCNDHDAHVFPGAPEICDGIDNQCSGDPGYGQADEGPPACSDNNACTTGDTCVNGSCQPSPALNCDDGNPCTNDSCDSAIGCQHTPINTGQTSCGIGACRRTVDNCLNGVPQTCVLGEPVPETCNGLDDDCDGFTDEGNPGGGELHEAAKLTASDATADRRWGGSVSLSGDTAIVGANYDDHACPVDPNCDSGSAYVFVRSSGMWSQQQKLTASDASAGDNFGDSVAIDGDTAVVGAPFDHAGAFWAGSVYVFVRSGGVWIQQQKLTPPIPATDAEFGYSVSMRDDTIVVGAPPFYAGDNGPGSAYVFRYHPELPLGSRWVEAQKLTPSDSAPNDRFGFSIAVGGDIVVVGAQATDGACPMDPECDSGSAYVFVKPVGGWSTLPSPMNETAKLTASDAAAADTFGHSVSVSVDIVMVGAERNDDSGSYSGSAYVFLKPVGGWSTAPFPMNEAEKLTASDAAAGDAFGVSVSVDGNAAVIGAFQPTDYGSSAAGSAYVFVRSGGVWTQQHKLTASDAAANDQFGSSISLSGETVLVAARFDDDAGTDSGSAYIFDLGCHDADGDGYGSPGNCSCSNGSAVDCNDNKPAVHPGAPEICDGIDNQCPGDPGYGQIDEGPPACDDGNACTQNDNCGEGVCSGSPITSPVEVQNLAVASDKATYNWSAATFATKYDVVRGRVGALPVGFSLGEEACFDNLASTALVDATAPTPGDGFWYLCRAENGCGIGTWGTQSDGTPRATTTCP